MTKQEILERIQKGVADTDDLFDYYNVKNIDTFEMTLAEKTKNVNVNLEYLNGAFDFIYKAREKDVYNPIEEKFYYYSMLLSSLYGMQLDEINIIVRTLGLFQSCMLFDKIYKDKPETIYFADLYKTYVDNQTSLRSVVEEYYKKLSKLLSENLKNFKMEDLEKLGESVLSELDKLPKNKVAGE
jgi:hypothetical protein